MIGGSFCIEGIDSTCATLKTFLDQITCTQLGKYITCTVALYKGIFCLFCLEQFVLWIIVLLAFK